MQPDCSDERDDEAALAVTTVERHLPEHRGEEQQRKPNGSRCQGISLRPLPSLLGPERLVLA